MNATPPTRRASPSPTRAAAARDATSRSDVARRRMLAPGESPLFVADWDRVLFVHFAVDPAALQPHVPFPLDTFNGDAYVSLVFFTQNHLRPRRGGRLAELLSAPLADHAFLNLRTYVRVANENGADEPGIHFLAEWIPNRLACLIGPRAYGLPYRLARNDYAYTADGIPTRCTVTTSDGATIALTARVDHDADFAPAATDLDRFLLEHYTAYTHRDGVTRRFRVWHEPWLQAPAEVALHSLDLLRAAAPYLANARYVGAHFSPGVRDVWIGPPRTLCDGNPFPGSVIPRGAVATGGISGRSSAPLLPEVPRRCAPRDDGRASDAPFIAVPPALVVVAALLSRTHLPPWAFMWVISLAVFFACKWISFRRVATRGTKATLPRTLAYLFAWVGMDAPDFLDPTHRPPPPARREWLAATTKTLAGVALFSAADYGTTTAAHPLLPGWLGTIGLVLALHFGVFHLLALAWRRAGVDADPIMRAPARAASLADFWGRRWNRAFHVLAHDLVFRPLLRRLGPAGATLATFAASGLVHDVVISLPAGAGYGLPTAYFLLQGLGVLLERSALGSLPRLRRAFAFACTVLPLPLLLHPPFVHNVIVPFLAATAGGVAMLDLSLTTLVALGGVCHLGILIASALVPRVLDWKGELTRLHPLTRHLVWTHGAFIVLTILAFGVISLVAPADLASGTRLARLFCGFVAAFWLSRLAIQLFLFDARPFLTNGLLKLGYHGLTAVFTFLGLVYGWAALAPEIGGAR